MNQRKFRGAFLEYNAQRGDTKVRKVGSSKRTHNSAGVVFLAQFYSSNVQLV